jgi:SAM-dependent methyltransferase
MRPWPRPYSRVVSFDVPADVYGRFMGRYSEQLAEKFAEFADLPTGARVLDVGCGPGALTAQLVERVGADAVSAIDPSPSFVAATRARVPDVDVRSGVSEHLPFPDRKFDAALAQLVVHFMTDPITGLSEMARVTRPGGVVTACVWDDAGGRSPLSTFWRAAREIAPGAGDESGRAGVREGHLEQLFEAAGMIEIVRTTLTVTVRYPTFDEWWGPYMLGVGPAGELVAGLDDDRRAALRARCAAILPPAPFDVTGSAWSVRAHPSPSLSGS